MGRTGFGRSAHSGAFISLASATLIALVATPSSAQQGLPELTIPDTTDAEVILEAARSAQAALESFRESRIPPDMSGRSRGCDERIGRMCFRFEDEESPLQDQPPELMLARRELIRALSDAHERLPADPWVLGQYVSYLVEDKLFGAADRASTACEVSEKWWCDALLGYSAQWAGNTQAAQEAFDRALAAMPESERSFWRAPDYAVSADAMEVFPTDNPQERERLVDRLWHLADPLYLVDGNDRLTEHYTRKVAIRIREDAANPYGLSWENDLEQLTVRYGIEVGWERGMGNPTSAASDARHIIGRQHPKSRQFIPPGEFLADPAAIAPDAWRIEARRPRTGYAASYAPEIWNMYSQVARFRRGDSLLVIGAYRPMPDEGRPMTQRPSRAERRTRSGDDRDRNAGTNPFESLNRPPPPPPSAVDNEVAMGPVTAGMFLVYPDGGTEFELRGSSERGVFGALVPNGDYVISLEVFSPDEKKAWRARQGVRQRSVPRDLAAASDLLILDAEGTLPETLEEAVPRALPGVRVRRGDPMVLSWEVYGLEIGEQATVTIGFNQEQPGFLRRAGEFLRLVEPDAPVEVRYDDAAAEALRGPIFRSVAMDVPTELEAGEYTLYVEIQLPGRAPMVISRGVTLLP